MTGSADIQLTTPPSVKIPKNNEKENFSWNCSVLFSAYVSTTQLASTCSKSISETLEQGVKSVQVNKNDDDLNPLLLTLNKCFTSFYSFSIWLWTSIMPAELRLYYRKQPFRSVLKNTSFTWTSVHFQVKLQAIDH